MVLMAPFMDVQGEDQSVPKDILNNMIYSCIIFQENEIVCQVTKLHYTALYIYICSTILSVSKLYSYSHLPGIVNFQALGNPYYHLPGMVLRTSFVL